MKEIIKINMDLDINEETGNVRVSFEQGLSSNIEDILTKKELNKIKEDLSNVCEMIAQAIKRDMAIQYEKLEEELIQEELDKKIDNCNTLDDLLDLIKEVFAENN